MKKAKVDNTALNTIWTEKYRPREFEEMLGHKYIVERTKAFVAAHNMPHLLFAGPAGCGKTTLALIIAKKFFGEHWHDNFLELNASDERGIAIVRQKIKDFARTKSFGASFKIIFLDESDALTRDAQQALRRTMEMFTNTCRFILSCNTSSKLIDPIQSRCSVFRFQLLEEKDIRKKIEKIAKQEKLKIDEKAMKALYKVSKGDLRRVTNLLQASATLTKKIDEEIVYETMSEATPHEIFDMLKIAVSGNFIAAREKLLDIMTKKALSGLDIIKVIQKEIWNLEINDNDKVKLTEKCGEIEFRLVEGSDAFIQLEALLANFLIVK
jgi:replication factor C small subunit